MKNSLKIFLAVAVSLIWFGADIRAGNQDKILAEIENKLNSIKTLQVDFVQEVNSGVFATIDRTEGKIFLQEGDKFRIESDEQTIVSDSVVIWIYSAENKQVKIDSVYKIDDLVRPSEYLFTFKDGYNVTLLDDNQCDFGNCFKVLLKAENDDSFIKEMTLLIDPETYLTHRAEYKDINGNLVTVTFDKYKIDKKIPPEVFEFKTPKGVEEVRLP